MNTSKQGFGFSQKVIVLAILAAFGPAHAEDDLAEYIKPESSVRVGVGAVSGDEKDRAIFGQYNGMRRNDFYGLFDLDYVRRNDDTGTWTTLQGRNLGLDTREIKFGQQKQGDWKYSLEYNQLVRNYQNTINTGMVDAGSATPTVVSLGAPGTGRDLNLQTKRKAAALNFGKWITPNLQFEANFRNEEKDGSRLYGRGVTCGTSITPFNHTICASGATGAMLLLPEPIDATTRQAEARLTFSGEKFLLSAAYYGSFYDNANGSLRPIIGSNLVTSGGTAIAPTAPIAGYMSQPLALAPDNQAHQFSLTGNYAFTQSTKATFKYAYTHATQDQDFAAMGLTGGPAGVSNLDGRVDTTLVQAGVTSRVMPKLTLVANTRYEERDNKTPIGFYAWDGGTNTQNSLQKMNGKVEANYQFTSSYRGTLGVDYEGLDFGTPSATYHPGGLNLMREKTDEVSYRVEFRRTLSETFTGAIGYIRSDREGSEWLRAAAGTPVLTDAQAAAEGSGRPVTPTMFQDRTRDKIRLSADWTPIEQLSVQFNIEDGKDEYDSPRTARFKGLGDADAKFYGIDASYALSDNWKLSAYWNHGKETQHVNHSLYIATLEAESTALGFGVAGKLSSKIDLGGNLTYLDDKYSYGQGIEPTGNSAGSVTSNQAYLTRTGGLPDTIFRVTRLNFFSKYALDKNSGLRLDLIHQRAKYDDWAWSYAGVPFTFSDNTTVSSQQKQNVTFVGVSYLYKFQ